MISVRLTSNNCAFLTGCNTLRTSINFLTNEGYSLIILQIFELYSEVSDFGHDPFNVLVLFFYQFVHFLNHFLVVECQILVVMVKPLEVASVFGDLFMEELHLFFNTRL